MKPARDVDGYISGAPEAVRGTLSELRAAIRTSVPQAEESISYGMPFYRHKGRLVYLSLWENHIGLYALSAPVLNQYKKELKGSLGSKGTLRSLSMKNFLSLIKKLVKAQARRNALGQKKRSHRTKAGLWRCPVCGREFAHPNQWHSHAGRPIDAHFQGRPEARLIYDELVKKLNEFGPLRTDAVKTSINLIARRHLGGVRVREGRASGSGSSWRESSPIAAS